jgi:peptidoglycan/LPS O-acetylase OafA/YrhL
MSAEPTKAGRVAALDLTKGVLVICMVLYHALNYTTQYHLSFRYFAFLPPSFIVITGFLLSGVYTAKHSISDWRLHSRLVIRGAKLLLLFTALNVLIELTIARNALGATPGLAVWWDYWFETYISGEGYTSRFEVLLPIAYLLLLAPVLLVIDRLHWLVLPVLTATVIGVLVWSARHGGNWYHAQLMTAGLIGLLLGRVPFAQLERLPRYTLLLAMAYAAYYAAGRMLGLGYLLQLAGAVIALALIYAICAPFSPSTFMGRRLEILGRYSLVAYIGQIGILQLIVQLTPRPEPVSLGFVVMTLITLILTIFGVEITDWARRRSTAVGGAYKAVFA